jgi:hypothetical protein
MTNIICENKTIVLENWVSLLFLHSRFFRKVRFVFQPKTDLSAGQENRVERCECSNPCQMKSFFSSTLSYKLLTLFTVKANYD